MKDLQDGSATGRQETVQRATSDATQSFVGHSCRWIVRCSVQNGPEAPVAPHCMLRAGQNGVKLWVSVRLAAADLAP